MDRKTFLAQPDVDGFINWLCANLSTLDVHLRFSPSRFVKGGLDQRVQGIQAVLQHYCWTNSWLDYQTGRPVVSDDWTSTRHSLSLLRDRLLTALASGCQSTTYQACRAVLAWGGVRGAIPFLHGLQQQGKLVQYLDNCRPLFALTGSQSLAQLNKHNILRFDAGLTKIHALADTTGSPIYDSRVGAAIAMLYALYRQTASATSRLNFASGSARGLQLRDPGELGFAGAPQFFTRHVTAWRWAQCQLELGWIIDETLKRSPALFDGTQEERCHGFEAALFMIGYDLRCLFPSGSNAALAIPDATNAASSTLPVPNPRKSGTWVPTSVPFVQLLQEYLACSQSAGHAVEPGEFRQWQIEVMHRKPSTADAYCAPLRASELDLASFTLEELELITQGGTTGLQTLMAGEVEFVAGDEREQVYLIDIFLCARSTQIAATCQLPADALLVRAGFAGKLSSARLIRRIGMALGQHFGLLSGDQPTAAFDAFFGRALDDLNEQMLQAAVTL